MAQAGKDNLSHEEFLKRFLSNEASAKFERQVKSRLATARGIRGRGIRGRFQGVPSELREP
jgi:hypothetical protein